IAPYSYFWTPVGGINATANNLAAGTYSCIITDANGCSTIVNATINEPGVFFIQCVESTPIACVGDSGAVTAIPNGGVPPYTYSWSSGATTATANGLPPGGYTCVVTDANAATTSCFITLFPATPINAAIFTNDPTTLCYGASALLESLPNIAYTYQWKKYGNPIAGEISNTINTTGKGNYTLCVTDSNGCSAESNVIVITKIGTTPAVITSPSVVFCKGDSLKLTVNSIPGSTYQWFRNGNLIPGATDSCYYTTGAGGYKVKKTDQNGCLAVSNKITVGITKPSVAITALAPHALPGPINVCVGETVVLVGSASGGAAPYTYQWFKWKKAIAGETSATYTSTVNTAQTNNRGGFRLQATDANGCTAKSRPNVQIIEVCRIGQFAKAHELELHVYPNPFSNTVSLDVVSSGDAPILIKVSDITGRVILEQKFNVADSIIPLYLQELEQGIYFIDAVQSDKKVSKKIIKAN
ncbi:MAG: T9SS type A sorting domain-containing protein, partial [Bacteroidia bacterium]|nr:T9SS type A sorting domain-containing protein [Bacteroidia bacterium]